MECVYSAQVQAQNKHSPPVRRKAIGVRKMNKRKLGSFALGVMLIALGVPAEAQRPTKVPRIGYLSIPTTVDFSSSRKGIDNSAGAAI
jgi:hypothetical protein